MKIKKYLKPVMVVAGATTLTGLVTMYTYNEDRHREGLEVYVIDLKFGHALFVRTPDDKRILINGGYNTEILNKLAYHLPFYSRHIDTIIATSMDKNSIGGLIPVLERYSVAEVYLPKYHDTYNQTTTGTDSIYRSFIDLVSRTLSLPVSELKFGDHIPLSQDLTLDILFPVERSSFKYAKSSPPELLFNIKYKEKVITYLDNISQKIQNYLAFNWMGDYTDVLIYFGGNRPGQVTKLLNENFKPKYLIYSEKDRSTQTKNSSSNTKTKKDNISQISSGDRYNMENKTVKINITNEKITITKLDSDSFLTN